MNDYIDRLIGRTLNKSHVIQPRLPAIFEPQTNDEPVLYKRKVDIEPSYHSSKEDVLITPRNEPDKQISSAYPVIKSIKTGKNDLRSHTSDRSESGIQKDLTGPDRSELEEPVPSLNFTHAKTEYTEEFRDTITDKNVPNENVAHEISFEPDNKRAENPDFIGSTNFINQTIGTESRPEESISKKVATQKPEDKTLEKTSDRFTPPHSSKNEITIQQHEEKTKSRSDHRLDGRLNSRLNSNSNIENTSQPLSFSQKHSDQKNGLQNPNDPESAFDPFKGKLVTGSRIEWNNKTSEISNDNLEQQESVIRVNIGRIEVRAVQPPTPPPQPQSKPFKPMLSLDDYLNQRNGG